MWYTLGLVEQDPAYRFKKSPSYISRTLTTISQFMYEHNTSLVVWPTRQQVLQHMPPHFINHQSVHSVYDGTEFFMEMPSGLEAQAIVFSPYKHHC